MKPKRATLQTRRRKPPLAAGQRGRILLLEPDELTRWSITTYLCRWFEVQTVESSADATQHVLGHAFDALVLSDKLSEAEVAEIQRVAADRNPRLRTVRTVTATSEPLLEQVATVQLEKPFELARLAQLLGVPQAETA